jgi:TonB family protein
MPTGLAGLSYGPGLDGIGGPGKGGTGPGPGRGSGDNDGDGGLGALKIGSGVSAPQPIFTPEPEYSEEARKAKLGGIVLLSLVVDASGRPVDIHVIRSLGLGLDEKAIEAVKRWVFAPGKKDGKPVAVRASAEVSFRLL